MPKRTDLKSILLLGAGPIVIGQACEFDYSGTQACKALREEGYRVVLVNSNPATIMTDPDMADAIYIEPIDWQTVEKIIEKERPDSLMLAFGGQTALNCGVTLYTSGILKKYKVAVLWTSVETIDITEDRKKFKQALDQVWATYAVSKHAWTVKEAIIAAENIGYPVLVRAAFALWWLGSWFVYNQQELELLLEKSFSYSDQVIIDESLKWWKELEYEAFSRKFLFKSSASG